MKSGRSDGGAVGATTARLLVPARRIAHFLYLLFNWSCMIIYGYQVYLWIRKGAWTRIPSRVVWSGAGSGPSAGGKLVEWMLNVELAYTLCAISMIFFGLKWLANRRVK